MIKDKNLRVLDYIDGKEILIQMGEEGSELSKAAIKLYRAIDMKNPTPVSINEAHENLVEEFGDVLNCIYAYFDDNAKKFGVLLQRQIRLLMRSASVGLSA